MVQLRNLPRRLSEMELRALSSNVSLFAIYTAASVIGLLLIRGWLPSARVEWINGGGVGWPALIACVGAGLYVVSFLVWMTILTRYEVSFAYPVAIGLTLLVLSVSSSLLLAENLTPQRLGGMVLILIGIALVTRS